MNIRQHNIIIKSNFRFTLFLTIFILAIIIIFTGITGIGSMDSSAELLSENQYHQITIDYGDNLWEIAEDYSPEKTDIRKFIYEIKKINNIDENDIIPGKKLLIPIYN